MADVADSWPELVAAEDTVEGVAGVWLAGAAEAGLGEGGEGDG